MNIGIKSNQLIITQNTDLYVIGMERGKATTKVKLKTRNRNENGNRNRNQTDPKVKSTRQLNFSATCVLSVLGATLVTNF